MKTNRFVLFVLKEYRYGETLSNEEILIVK